MAIRVLVADDHALVRHGLRQLITLEDDFTVVAEACDAWEAMDRVRVGGFDVVLLDMSMPGPSGFELIRRIKSEAPRAGVLVLSMHADWQMAARAVKAGASGYLTKDSEPDVLLEALRQVGRGANFMDPELAKRMIFSHATAPEQDPRNELTTREYQVFMGMVKGRSLVDIATELQLSAKTVSTHKFRLMRRLGVTTTTELLRYAIDRGVIE